MFGLLRPLFRGLGNAWRDATVAGKIVILLCYAALSAAVVAFYAKQTH